MRYLFPSLFVLVLVTPFALRLAVGTSAQERFNDAPLRLVIITPHSEGIRREFQEAFSAWHKQTYGQAVHLDYRFYGGAADILKYFQSSKTLYAATGTYEIDLVWGGGDDLFERQLKGGGFLQQTTLPPELMRAAFPTPDIGGVPLYDPKGTWYGTAVSSFGIVYNKQILNYLGLPEPKQWDDLADPRYEGWVVMADPARSSSAKAAFMTIIERKMADAAERGGTPDEGWARGMGLIRLISANARIFSDASSSVPKLVSSGDVAAGMTIDFYGRTEVEYVGDARLGYVEPVGATTVDPDPIAIVTGSQRRDLAQRYVEFLLSPRGQRLWIYKPGSPDGPRQTALRRLPARRDTYDDLTHFTDRVNPFTVAADFNTRADRKETFSIIGELLQVSCVDPLVELRQTREAITASPRRAELEGKLGTFPFGQAEALRRMKQYRALQNRPTEQLDLIRQWGREFQNEYGALRRSAG